MGLPFLVTSLEAPGKLRLILGLIYWVNQLFCLEQQFSNLFDREVIFGKQTANSRQISTFIVYMYIYNNNESGNVLLEEQ